MTSNPTDMNITKVSTGMCVTVSKREMKAALLRAKPAMARRTTLPVLGCVLFTVRNNNLTLLVSDLDESIEQRVPASGRQDGSIAIEYRTLKKIVDKADAEVLRIEVTGYRSEEIVKDAPRITTPVVTIRAGGATYEIEGVVPEEYPEPHVIPDGSATLSVEAEALKATYKRVRFAVSKEETRPVLNGPYLHVRGDGLAMVATNGHRLSLVPMPVPAAVGGVAVQERSVGMIIRPRALDMVVASADPGEEIDCRYEGGFLQVRTEVATVTTRLIEGPYPDYQRVIPEESSCVAVVSRLALLGAVDRVNVLAPSQTHRMKLRFRDVGVMVETSAPDLGQAREMVNCTYEGEPLDIGFSAEYLLEILRNLTAEEIRVSMATPERAAIFEEVGADAGALMLLMPLRLLD